MSSIIPHDFLMEYPSNFPLREYQLNISKIALLNNTLVCLPTGMGKTLVASVVMHNFRRWFPCGKIIFLAPVKPLLSQQISACHDVVGIPEEEIAHLEGSVSVSKRQLYWNSKRVFFCTPQVLLNDLKSGKCDPCSIVLLVFDEAHRATGNYAYTNVVSFISTIYMLSQSHSLLVARLALSPSKTKSFGFWH